MILVQGILDELRHQAELQGKKNYRCIEVDWRVIIALCDEIEAFREKEKAANPLVCVQSDMAKYERSTEESEKWKLKKPDAEFTRPFLTGESVLFQGKEYLFDHYGKDGILCYIYEESVGPLNGSFGVCVANVSRVPL